MSLPKSVHYCNKNPDNIIYYIFKDAVFDEWKLLEYVLRNVEYLSVTIEYCPFCGMDLSKEPDWNFANANLAKRVYENTIKPVMEKRG